MKYNGDEISDSEWSAAECGFKKDEKKIVIKVDLYKLKKNLGRLEKRLGKSNHPFLQGLRKRIQILEKKLEVK